MTQSNGNSTAAPRSSAARQWKQLVQTTKKPKNGESNSITVYFTRKLVSHLYAPNAKLVSFEINCDIITFTIFVAYTFGKSNFVSEFLPSYNEIYGAPFVKISYLTELAQKLLSLAEIAISACRDSAGACRRARFQRALSVRAFVIHFQY